eukprot:322069_1
MDLIREIKVIPKVEMRANQSEMKGMNHRLNVFKDQLVRSIQETTGIEIQLSQSSQSANNVHIMQFANKDALKEARKEIDKIRANPKYNNEYKIQFRHISKADDETKKQVGFVNKMQEKVYRIDIKNKTDPISQMVKNHLKSREECRIKLLVLNGSNSFILGKIFSEYVENVICIHPFVKIRDSTTAIFTKYFDQSLIKNTNVSTPLSQSVLKSYNMAKRHVTKECSNDNACGSHSHSHQKRLNRMQSIERIRQKAQQFAQLHLSENWNALQNQMKDPIKFKKYRLEMQKSGVNMNDDDLGDIYDDKTLILSNLSHDTMCELVQYLEDKTHPYFVERKKYQKNDHYSEFSVAYLKFESESDRKRAMKLLKQKQIDEELEFSDIDGKLLGGNDINKQCTDLGWTYRVVPRCCCSPHHPHMTEDKLILLQDGFIINRERYINNKLARQTCAAIGQYYASLGKPYDCLFRIYCEENGLDKDDEFLEELRTSYDDCLFCAFDKNFPFDKQPKDHATRMRFIYDLIKKCVKNPNSFSKLLIDVFLSDQKVQEIANTVFPENVFAEPELIYFFAVGYFNNLPLLTWLMDAYSMDKSKHNELCLEDWAQQNKFMNDLMFVDKDKGTKLNIALSAYNRLPTSLQHESVTKINDGITFDEFYERMHYGYSHGHMSVNAPRYQQYYMMAGDVSRSDEVLDLYLYAKEHKLHLHDDAKNEMSNQGISLPIM